jgi:hypothetical protein
VVVHVEAITERNAERILACYDLTRLSPTALIMKTVHAVLLILLSQQLASLTAAARAPYSAAQYTSDYSSMGPCEVAEQQLEPLQLPEDSGCGSYCRLTPHLHLPAQSNTSSSLAELAAGPSGNVNAERCRASDLPTIVFFSGFQLRSAYYAPYARWLASWGFACVQYDLAFLHIVPDEVEVGNTMGPSSHRQDASSAVRRLVPRGCEQQAMH